MPGEGVLRVLVAKVNLIALLHDDLAVARFGGGIDFGKKDAGGRVAFSGSVFDGRVGVDLHFHFDGVAVESGIQIEVDDLGDDTLAGFNAKKFLAGSMNRARAVAVKVVTDRSDLAVVISRGEGFGEQAVALLGTGSEFVEIGNSHGISGSQFENIVGGEFENIGFGRHVFVALAADLHVVDGNGLAAVFEEFEFDIAQLAGWHGKRPAVFLLFDFGGRSGSEFLDVGD